MLRLHSFCSDLKSSGFFDVTAISKVKIAFEEKNDFEDRRFGVGWKASGEEGGGEGGGPMETIPSKNSTFK